MKEYKVSEEKLDELNKLFFSLCNIELERLDFDHLGDCIDFLSDWIDDVRDNNDR